MAHSLKVSAADLGTNTLKVTHATRLDGGKLTEMQHASDTVRLGFGIETTGRIENHRLEECIRFLKEQEAIGLAYGAEAFIGVATEALRIAENGPELLDRIHSETGWIIEIISGDREAELTYLGLADQVPDGVDCAIVDIGGGSTEVVVIREGKVVLQQSLAVGSGRLADRFFDCDPPGKPAVKNAIIAAREDIDQLLQGEGNVGFMMLAGGSGLFMNQLIQQLWNESPFNLELLKQLEKHLEQSKAQETVDRIDIPLARALVLPASVAVGIAMMERFSCTQAVGVPSGIRMGLIRECHSK